MERAAPLKVTSRDCELLRALGLSVRMLSLLQIGRKWWPNSESPQQTAREWPDRLCGKGSQLESPTGSPPLAG